MVKPKTMPMEESFTVLEYLVKSCTIDTPTIKLPTIKDTAVAKEIGSTGGAETISPAGTTVNVFITPPITSRNNSGTPNWDGTLMPL